MSHDINLLNPYSRIAVSSSSSSREEKEEEFPVSEKEALPPIDMLSNDVLGGKIFNYTTNVCRKNLGAIRGTCRKWREVFDVHNLRVSWGMLPKEIKTPSLRVLVNQIVFIDRFVSEVIASALNPDYAALSQLDQADLLNRIKDMDPSGFSRFSQLTQSLREKGAPIPHQHAVIGFELSPYEKMQRKLDTSLETIWTRIQQQIDFEGAPIPANAETIREWLSNPINADKIARITQLSLSRMKLEILPPEIGKLSQLKELNLIENKLTILPPEIGNLSQLTKLQFRFNRLTTLPPTIGNLSQLKELCVSENCLTILPSEIGKLSKLTWISLSGNQLTVLPLEIAGLSELKYLDLSANRLTILPPEIGNLSQLQRFDLANNWLLRLPPEIGNLSRVQELNLFNNPLTTLPAEIFKISQTIYTDNLHNTLLLFTLPRDFCPSISDRFIKIRYLTESFLDCSDYSCRTPLASLCQKIHLGYEGYLLRDTFETLSSDMQERIHRAKKKQHINQAIHQEQMQQRFCTRTVYNPASWWSLSPEMEADLFADNPSFVSAVITVLQNKWRSFSEDERSQINKQYEILARQPKKSNHRASRDLNIIRLIDAMELVSRS